MQLYTILFYFYAGAILTVFIATPRSQGVRLLNSCSCIGQTVTFECIVTGGTITVWSGSAFMCEGNEISLRHGRFTNSEAIGSCNDEAIVGRGVASNGTQFTSQLDVILSSELLGDTVSCSVEDGSNLNITGTANLAKNTTSNV